MHSEVCFINLGQMSPRRSWLLPPVAIKQSAYVSSLWLPAWTWVMKTKMKRLSWTMSAFSWLECCTDRGAVDVTLISPTWSWEASHPVGNRPLLNQCLVKITKHFTRDGGSKAWSTKKQFYLNQCICIFLCYCTSWIYQDEFLLFTQQKFLYCDKYCYCA